MANDDIAPDGAGAAIGNIRPRTLNTDILLRSLDLDGLAKSSLAAQTPDTLAALTAYAQGINARIAEINATALSRCARDVCL